MWKRKAGCDIMYQCLIALIYGQMEHGGGCDSCDNKQWMKMVGRERSNVTECTGGGAKVREKDEEKQSALCRLTGPCQCSL